MAKREVPEVYRFPQCRTRRKDPHLMVLHVMQCKRPLCHCLRVHHPHRPGSYALCVQRPFSELLIAERMGADDEQLFEMAIEIAFTTPGTPSVACPF